MAKAAAKIKEPAFETFPEIEQQSEEWIKIRLGTPTASNFAMVLRDGDSKTRAQYMRKLAGELLTGRPAEGKLITAAMQRGNEMEPEARDHYSRKNFVTLNRIGFARRKLPSGRYVGCSPDGLIGKKKALEIKTMQPDLMIELLERGAGLPPEHRAQVNSTMWVMDLEEVDLMLFYRGMPHAPQFTIKRNEDVMKEISDAAEVFDHELHKLVAKIKSMGPR